MFADVVMPRDTFIGKNPRTRCRRGAGRGIPGGGRSLAGVPRLPPRLHAMVARLSQNHAQAELKVTHQRSGTPIIGQGPTPCRPRSGPYADQPPAAWPNRRRFRWSAATRGVYYQQTRNLLMSYSPKKPGFFQRHEKRRLSRAFACQAPLARPLQERVAFTPKLPVHLTGFPLPDAVQELGAATEEDLNALARPASAFGRVHTGVQRERDAGAPEIIGPFCRPGAELHAREHVLPRPRPRHA